MVEEIERQQRGEPRSVTSQRGKSPSDKNSTAASKYYLPSEENLTGQKFLRQHSLQHVPMYKDKNNRMSTGTIPDSRTQSSTDSISLDVRLKKLPQRSESHNVQESYHSSKAKSPSASFPAAKEQLDRVLSQPAVSSVGAKEQLDRVLSQPAVPSVGAKEQLDRVLSQPAVPSVGALGGGELLTPAALEQSFSSQSSVVTDIPDRVRVNSDFVQSLNVSYSCSM